MTTFKRALIAITLAAATALGTVAGVGTAGADSSEPTIGDVVEYYFYSDVKVNESINWFTADNDMDDMSSPSFPKYSKKSDLYRASTRFTSRSTYQMTGAAVQTSGYFAACQVYVDGVKTAEEIARGRYALAVC